MIEPLWKTAWWYLMKLNIHFPCDPAIPLLDIYPREMNSHKHLYVNLHGRIIYNSTELALAHHGSKYLQCINLNDISTICKELL